MPQMRDNLVLQKSAMKSRYPNFMFVEKGNSKYWIGRLKPSEYSEDYRVKIIYRNGIAPKAFILSPELKKNNVRLMTIGVSTFIRMVHCVFSILKSKDGKLVGSLQKYLSRGFASICIFMSAGLRRGSGLQTKHRMGSKKNED